MKPLILLLLIPLLGPASGKDVQSQLSHSDLVAQNAELEKNLEAYKLKINELEKRISVYSQTDDQKSQAFDTTDLEKIPDIYRFKRQVVNSTCQCPEKPGEAATRMEGQVNCPNGDEDGTPNYNGMNAFDFSIQEEMTVDYCEPWGTLEGTADQILRRVFHDVLESYLGGVLRCTALGGVHTGLQCIYYSKKNETSSWEDAHTHCEKKGGKLAIISDNDLEAVQDHIKIAHSSFTPMWVDGKYDGGKWKWTSTGEEIDEKITSTLDMSEGADCLRLMHDKYKATHCIIPDSAYLCDLGTCHDKYKVYRKCLKKKVKKILQKVDKHQKKTQWKKGPRKQRKTKPKPAQRRSKRAILFGIWGWFFGFGMGDSAANSYDLCNPVKEEKYKH